MAKAGTRLLQQSIWLLTFTKGKCGTAGSGFSSGGAGLSQAPAPHSRADRVVDRRLPGAVVPAC